jgi:hypothetical protein
VPDVTVGVEDVQVSFNSFLWGGVSHPAGICGSVLAQIPPENETQAYEYMQILAICLV